MESAFAKPRLATLLDHFSAIEDPCVSWRVVLSMAVQKSPELAG